MFGVIRAVEYNEKLNQSRLHFECTHIDTVMKNEVLSFVYNMLPEREKEVYEAMKMTDEDETESTNQEKAEEAAELKEIIATEKRSSVIDEYNDNK